MSESKKAPVQETRGIAGPGTIDWEEHERVWTAYAAKYGGYQTAQRIAERGGFSYAELVEFLGHDPTTWKPRQ